MSLESRPLLCLLLMLGLMPAIPASEPTPRNFITQREGKLYDGGREFRFVSWNIPNLHNVEDAFSFLGRSPWRWPNEFEIADALESVKQMGGQVARTYVISVRRQGGDMGANVHVLGPNQFNEEAFQTLDLVLKVASEKGIRIIIPLVDNWRWWGGVREYEAFRNKQEGDFWTDPLVIKDFESTVRYLLNRRNTLTGVRYHDDPTIFGWETGNELDAPPTWTARIAATLKKLDPNHLVIDGRSLHGVPTTSLSNPNIDVVTTHHYPNSGNNNAESVAHTIDVIAGKKAYFVGEFGFLSIEEAQRILDTVIDEGASGALYWSLRFHRREGGFYWHHEPSGGDLYKAYHWPGFPEGDPYRENLVLPMLRSAAYRIRGLEAPPLPAPQAPSLLPSTRPGVFSWQGSAGASGYDIERAESEMGPWETIAKNLSDATFQYRPLYADESARPGVGYYYRVRARNVSGVSPASNTLGPITVNTRLLVDEMEDTSRLHASTGTIELRSGNARTAQEDVHRLALAPGASVTYRLSEPIHGMKVWLFCENDSQNIEVATSSQGIDFKPLEHQRLTAPATKNDYGYLFPILVTAEGGAKSPFLRLSIPEGSDFQKVEISRVEIRYGGKGD